MRLLTFYLLTTIGSLLCVHASWLPVKAWLSQELISYSWQKSLQQQRVSTNKTMIKPWPWADTFPIAELSFKRIKKNIVVLNGGDPTTLAFSAGAVAPFNQTNSTTPFVVAGHRDSHFAFLKEIRMKDVISMTDQNGQSQLYQVEAIDIVDASLGNLPITDNDNDNSLILITCYPFNSISEEANERYVITAKLL